MKINLPFFKDEDARGCQGHSDLSKLEMGLDSV